MWFLLRLLPLLLLPALAWGQALHQEKVGFYIANKAGDDCSQATLQAADENAITRRQILVIPPVDRFGNTCQWIINSNLTLVSPVFVSYAADQPALLVSQGVTLTLSECPFVWGPYFIAEANETTTGTVAFPGGCNCSLGGPDNWLQCNVSSALGAISGLSDVNADANASLHEMMIGDGSEFRGKPLPLCNSATEKAHYNPDTQSWACVPDVGAGTTTLQAAFDAGTGEISGALCGTKTVKVYNVDPTTYCEICVDAGGTPKTVCICEGLGCDNVLGIAADRNFVLHDVENALDMWTIDPDAASPQAMYQIHDGYQLLGSIEWPAAAMFGDGTECDTDPTSETINGVLTQGLRCPMTTSEVDGIIHGLPVTLPGNFEKTAGVEFFIKAYLITDAGAGTWHGQITADCVGAGESPGTYGTAVGLDLTPAVGDVVDDEIHGTAAGVFDTDTTGADCDPGDTFYWRFTSCDTDATPSTGCTSSAGFENDMSISSIRMQYKKNSLSE